MDTIIFLLIFATLVTMVVAGKRSIIAAFLLTLVLTALLFNHHVTAKLPLGAAAGWPC